MLTSDSGAEAALETPSPSSSGAAHLPEAPEGLRFGDYVLEEEIAHGGMGVVYRARQISLGRMVAIKLLLLGRYSSAESVERFRREAQSAAALRHPHIVSIHEIGEHDGQQFFSMDYVDGQNLGELVRSGPFEARRAAEVVLDIARAIHYAHEQGVLHRDLKPGNVLLDAFGQVRITDFGLAKKLDGNSGLTVTGQMVGTPNYLSPEQAAGKHSELGPASDVYSIGALLYELLTGRPPFLANTLPETLLRIRDTEPVSPRALNHALDRDVETICLKCLRKEPVHRYPTARALADDLDCWLHGRPIKARPVSSFERSWLWARRNPRLAWMAGLAFAALAGLSATLAVANVRIAAAQHQTQLQADEARKAELSARVAQSNALRQAYSAGMLSASDALERGQIDTARQYLESAPVELRGWEWRHLASRLDLTTLVRDQPRSEKSQVHLLADGRSYYLAANTPTLVIRQYDMETGRLLTEIPTGGYLMASWLNASAKQMVLAVLDTPTSPESLQTWDLDHGVLLFKHPSPDGHLLNWADRDGSRIAYESARRIFIFDTKSGTSRGSAAEVTSTSRDEEPMGFSPDESRLAVCKSSGEVALLDAGSLTVLSTFRAHDNIISAMAFSPDSHLLATGSQEIRITDVSANPPALVSILPGHGALVTALCFSPDGSILASCARDKTLRLWETRTGSPRGIFESDSVDPHPAFLPGGKTVINCDHKGVRFWDVDSSGAWTLRGHHSFVYPVVLSPDGGTIYSGGWDGFVGQPGCLRIWDAATGGLIASTGSAQDYIRAADLSRDGSRLAVSIASAIGQHSRIDILDTATGATVASIRDLSDDKTVAVDSIAFDPRAENVVWIDGVNGMAHLAEARTGALGKSRRVFNGDGLSSHLAWSPDGSLIALNIRIGPTIDLLDAQSLELVRQWPHGYNGWINSISFSPDGRRLLTPSSAGKVGVWDTATGKRVHELVGHGDEVLYAAYSPDGKRIASGGRDDNVRIWDAETFDQLAHLGGHEDYVFSLAWRSDSQELVSSSGDHTVRIWDTVPMKDRMRARRERQALLSELEPKVRQLFADLGDAGKVVEKVKSDQSLSPRARQVALQVALRISFDQLNAVASEPRPQSREGEGNRPDKARLQR